MSKCPLRKTKPAHGDRFHSYKNFFKRTIVHIKPFTVYNGQAEIIIEILKEVEKKHEDKDSTEHIFSEQIQLHFKHIKELGFMYLF